MRRSLECVVVAAVLALTAAPWSGASAQGSLANPGGGGAPPAAAPAPSAPSGSLSGGGGGGGGGGRAVAPAPAPQGSLGQRAPQQRNFGQRSFPQPGSLATGGSSVDPGRHWGGRRGVYQGGRYGYRDWRYRRHYRDYGPGYGIYVAPPAYVYGRSWCHRHHRAHRVMRHCHPYSVRWHRHGRWR